jgi:hypothetical protein
LGKEGVQNMPTNRRGSKKLEHDDTRSKEIKTEGVKASAPVKIISIACDHKGYFYGLGEDGSMYRLTEDNSGWVSLQ